ncbi:TerC family protein [Schaalia suimastitidis]|uniref:TerC family protein n=1 Tax=Schaalia suimastitidis TaxID=121163 RepID=UPI00040BD1FD|nr:TerC family protein [Schaalia suimastitidis]
MDVHAFGWLGLAAVVLILITVDIVGHVRTPHAPTLKEAAWWSAGYVVLGLAFGLIIWLIYGAGYAGEYFAGFLTEKALSLDNLFVFIIIMASFRVPREYQQKALLSGIIIALILRLVFILVGAAMVERFSWLFYFFGAWLLYTAWGQAKEGVEEPGSADDEYHENRFVRTMRRIFPVTDGFMGQKFLHRHGGKTYITPMLLVVFALGSADIMFAFDSIPAIFGLTQEPYLVFAANAFALLGLRQLYFLVDGLLERLVYLHYGLAAILGFIGVKLILHAMHENAVPFINGGQGMHWAPEIGIIPSLAFILVTITITVVASLAKSRRDAVAAR